MIPLAQTTDTFRVFVSSTFNDLKRERDALKRNVFPRLRKLCMDRGCRFQAIDLRWGIREEASLDQRTMRICLDELRRCQRVTPRPNFVVLLGQRYGWRPLPEEIEAGEFERMLGQIEEEEDREVLTNWYQRDENNIPPIYYLKKRTGRYEDWEAWQEEEGRIRALLLGAATRLDLEDEKRFKYVASATEREIREGALGVEDADEHVFFFFREIEGLPRDRSAGDYLDSDGDGNPLPRIPQRLADLKERIQDELPANIYRYASRWREGEITTGHIDELCDDVYRKLSEVIESQMDRREEMDSLDVEIEGHRAFGMERSAFFTGRTSMLDGIEDYLEGDDDHPLALFGKGGTGKSALLARAALQAEKRYPSSKVVFRFIGATPGSSDGLTLLYGICRQLIRHHGGQVKDIPFEWDQLVPFFLGQLDKASQQSRLLLFIDSLDQLADAHRARSLAWVPPLLPPNVKMVLTTRPTQELQALREKLESESLMELGPMSLKEGNTLLSLWLKDAGRKLRGSQRKEILGEFVKAEGNPLYLRMAFGEARLWRSESGRIDLASGVEGIIRDLYGRLSNEENHGKVFTSRTLSYLAASRDGLAEDELMDLLSSDREVYEDFSKRARHQPPRRRLPVAVWSRFYYDMEPYLAHKRTEGMTLLDFYHRELVEVALEDYLSGDEGSNRHLFLADYFEDQPLTPRKVRELPWQLSEAKAWGRLYDLLSDPEFFTAAWKADRFDLLGYWARVEENSDLRMVEGYRKVIEQPRDYNEFLASRVAFLLYETGHPVDALSLQDYLVYSSRDAGEEDMLQASLGAKANILYSKGELRGALNLYRESEEICRQTGDQDSLQISLGNQAAVLKDLGDLDKAMELHKEEEEICRRIRNRESLARSLGNQAIILYLRGNPGGAMELQKEAESICREIGDKSGLARSLGNQANILCIWRDLEGAMRLHKEEERIYRTIGHKGGLARSTGNQANILYLSGNLDGAMELLGEQENICREIEDKSGLARSLGNQAHIIGDRGDIDRAMELHKEAEKICRETGNKHDLVASLYNQSLLLVELEDNIGAMELFKKTESISREIGNQSVLARSLGSQAEILYYWGDQEGAIQACREEGKVSRELEDKEGIAIALARLARSLAEKGTYDNIVEALSLAEEAYRLATDNNLTEIEGFIRSLLERLEAILDSLS